MVNSPHKVISGKPVATGGVLTGPVNTTRPTTARTAANENFTACGYVSEDGLSKAETRDGNVIKDWSGLVVKRTQSGFEVTISFAFLEYLNGDSAKAIYGDDAVTVSAANTQHGEQLTIAVKGKEAPHRAWLFAMADGESLTTLYFGDAQVTEVGETAYNTAGAAVRQVTLTAYPDANGDFFVELTDDGQKVTSGS